jgi:trk system potassium uptake protein TrkA
MKKQVVVIGLGRFGTHLATSLYNIGHDVLAMDTDEERVQRMIGRVTYPVAGNATNEVVLKELGITDYDAAVVAIGSDIVSSIMTSVLLKTLGIPYIVSRAHNEIHGNTLERIGVDKVIHAEAEMGTRMAHNLFNPNVQEYLELAPSFGLSRLKIPNHFDNMTLRELGFSGPRDSNGLVVMAIRRGDDVTLNPDGEDRLQAGDQVVIAGRDELLDELES